MRGLQMLEFVWVGVFFGYWDSCSSATAQQFDLLPSQFQSVLAGGRREVELQTSALAGSSGLNSLSICI